MPVSTTVTCYLCGASKPIPEMAFFASPALGDAVDFAVSATWVCPNPCFDKARNSERIRGKIDAEHDAIEHRNRANLQTALQATESDELHLASLPHGLRVTESDLARLKGLRGDFSVENLQDEETLTAAFRLLRNHQRLPFYKPDGTELWDYSELTERLANLERNIGGAR